MSAVVKHLHSPRPFPPDVRSAFLAEVEATLGLTFPPDTEFEYCDDGKFRSATPYGDKKPTKFWYIARDEPFVRMCYGHWPTDEGKKRSWEYGVRPLLTDAQTEELRRRDREERRALAAEKQRQDFIRRAEVHNDWERGQPIAAQFSYLERKGITDSLPPEWRHVSHRFLREHETPWGKTKPLRRTDEPALMIPLRKISSLALVTAEYIAADGEKDYAYGLSPKGAAFIFGEYAEGAPVYVCEGIATAWTVHHLTRCMTLRAGSAGNLKAVAKDVREHLGTAAQIVVCAERGNGHAQGEAAAVSVNGVVCAPPFEDGDEGSDFNDFWLLHGDDATREALQNFEQPFDAPDAGSQDAAQLEWVERINREYFIARWGEVTICRENEDGSVTPESDRSFNLAIANRRVPGSNAPPHQVWRKSQYRREKGQVAYDPEWTFLDRKLDCNLWRGLAIKPAPGKCDLWKKHLEMAVAGGDKVIFDYIWKWCARLVQHPGAPAGVALVLTGEEGTGKGTVFNALLKIFGRHGLLLNKTEQLAGRFTSHLECVSFIFGDEMGWAKDHALRNALYTYITEPRFTVEPKGRPQYSIRNTLTFGLATNKTHAVQIARDSRRFFVVQVVDVFGHLTGEAKRRERKQYFDALYWELDSGGYGALLHELLSTDLTDFDPQVFPVTVAHRDNVEQSLEVDARWLVEVLRYGTPWLTVDRFEVPLGELNVWPADKPLQVPKRSLFEDCQRFCRQEGARGVTEPTFWKNMKKIFGVHLEETHKNTGAARVRHVKLPALAEARGIVAEALGIAPIEDPIEDSQ
jgi:hypothetical protein